MTEALHDGISLFFCLKVGVLFRKICFCDKKVANYFVGDFI